MEDYNKAVEKYNKDIQKFYEGINFEIGKVLEKQGKLKEGLEDTFDSIAEKQNESRNDSIRNYIEDQYIAMRDTQKEIENMKK
jgi:hypothetical protein